MNGKWVNQLLIRPNFELILTKVRIKPRAKNRVALSYLLKEEFFFRIDVTRRWPVFDKENKCAWKRNVLRDHLIPVCQTTVTVINTCGVPKLVKNWDHAIGEQKGPTRRPWAKSLHSFLSPSQLFSSMWRITKKLKQENTRENDNLRKQARD